MKAKKAAKNKLVGVKWCEIHKQWFIKNLVGTELNNVNNNGKKYMLAQTPLESCDDKKPASLQVFHLKNE